MLSLEDGNEDLEKTFNIAMQFSHIVSLVFAAATKSGMKLRHLAGHSCFKIWKHKSQEKMNSERPSNIMCNQN